MQLKQAARLAGFCAATLLASATVARAEPDSRAQAPAREYDVHASSELATYGDTDHVFVVSPSVAAVVSKPTAGWTVGGSYLVDVVSAASVDIVSTASRRFEELRHAGALDGGYKIGNLGIAANANLSIEPDYQSYTGGGALSYDLFEKNLSVLIAYYHGYDIAGRHDTPWDVWNHQINTDGIKAGGTIILDRATFLAIVADTIFEDGDTSKPYRYVPLFSPGTIVPVGASIDDVTRLRLSARALEQLPTSRNRYALSTRMGHRFANATLRLDERAYTDTWGLKATTSDGRLIFQPWQRVEAGPHVRVHAQSAVDFWQRAYTVRPGLDFPALRTGDRELGPLVNLTGGGSLRWLLGKNPEPRSLMVGIDLNLTSTSYLNDIYISQRTSFVSALTWEMDL